MDNQQIGLMLALKQLGMDLKIESFNDRLVLQKSVMLIQKAGVNLGYSYNWHLRGPYSPGLTSDAFAITPRTSEFQQELPRWNLDQPSAEKLKKLKPLFEIPGGEDAVPYLELRASILYVLDHEKIDAGNAAAIHASLVRRGKPFTMAQVESAIGQLREFELLGN